LTSLPNAIDVIGDQFESSKQYSISSELVDKYSTYKGLTFDTQIKVPSFSYYFDIQIGYDFLTATMDGSLYFKDNKDTLVYIG
jgi:hypothetical protein